MGIRADIQSLSPSALIELFELDMSVTTSGGKLYFHAGTNGLSQPIVWQR
ncbi:phage minor tail protein L, partial [Klebsiella pneumoniae]|nr:phage minor tail protein L [Klebsiella pneumoniae]